MPAKFKKVTCGGCLVDEQGDQELAKDLDDPLVGDQVVGLFGCDVGQGRPNLGEKDHGSGVATAHAQRRQGKQPNHGRAQ